MKVLMVCPYSLSRPGGVQGQVLGLARELRALDIDTRVVAPCDGPPPRAGVITVGESVLWENNGSYAPIATSTQAARRTIDALAMFEPDVVHLHEPMVPGPALSLLIGYHGPMVSTHHISGHVGREWAMPAVRANMERIGLRVAVSESARVTAVEALGGEYTVLWNGVEVEQFEDAAPYPSDRPAVLFCNRHEQRKGLSVLLDAWAGLERDAVLWIASSGPQTAELRRRNIPNVEWLGVIPDPERNARFAGASVFCAPSTSGESFGVVLLEAMAGGAAVVASDIDGYKNVARADRDALLVRPDDPLSLREALRRVLDDDALREKLVGAGHERAAELSMTRLATRYAELYDQLLGVSRS
jgi:phosphatidylinositol alpha-mannosyltransferase